MAKIWFFGDSFCANNSNWVKQVAENVGCKIANFGVGGASIDDTLTTLIKKSKEIKKQDYVVVCFTSPRRHLFNGINLRVGLIEQELPIEDWVAWDEKRGHYMPIDEGMVEAYKLFFKHLYNEDEENLKHTITVNHIINDVLPSLPTANSIYFDSMQEIPIKYEFFHHNQPAICKPFWVIAIDFLQSKHSSLPYEEFHNLLIEQTTRDNHFLDHPEYVKEWWSNLNPVLELIGAGQKI
jgi:hypothetical protein